MTTLRSAYDLQNTKKNPRTSSHVHAFWLSHIQPDLERRGTYQGRVGNYGYGYDNLPANISIKDLVFTARWLGFSAFYTNRYVRIEFRSEFI